MKKLLLILAVIMMTTGIAAQVPQGITHQAVMRDSQNLPIAEAAIGVRISILQGSADGVAVYVETHTPVSNANGLITYVIGQGSVVSGMFSGIDWSEGPYFLKTEADPEGGTNYSITGVTQFLSVPYANFSDMSAYSKKASTLTDGDNVGEWLYWDGNTWVPIEPGQYGQTLSWCSGIPTWGPCPPSVPVVTTGAVTNITESTATGSGNVVNEGSAFVSTRGLVWGTDPNPTLQQNDGSANSGSGTGSFTVNLSGLTAQTLYYVRAYATNNQGTAYGNQVTFTTDAPTTFPPTVSTNPVTEITETSATTGGNISDDGGSAVSARGVVWHTSSNPTLENHLGQTNDGSGSGSYVSEISGLQPNTGYYVRAYAVNSQGVSYGNQRVFVTQQDGDLPTVITAEASDITHTTATVSGEVTDDGGSPVLARGVCWSTEESPTLDDSFIVEGEGLGGFTGTLTGLAAETTYYVRTFATNTQGLAYGNQISFVTQSAPVEAYPPIVVITSLSNGQPGLRVIDGEVTDDGGAEVTARGFVWDTVEGPTLEQNEGFSADGDGLGEFTINFDDLTPNTKYYIKAYATNSEGTAYSEQKFFHFWDYHGTVTDIDNNVYHTVMIGDQEWMAENLRVSRYRNGIPIPTGLSNSAWQATTEGAYAIYNNDSNMFEAYGILYNWYAVDHSFGLCPAGWSVPSDADWTTLVDYAVGQGYPNAWNNPNGAGNALRSCRQVGHPDGGDCNTSEHPRWNSYSPHFGFDEFGFSALPGGGRWSNGSFSAVGSYGSWWTSTESSSTSAWRRAIEYLEGNVPRLGSNYTVGLSVRCLRDITNEPTLYNLHLEVHPEGAGSVSGAGEYEEGSEVSITATAYEGWEFVEWTGDIDYIDDVVSPQIHVTMPAGNVTLTANFQQEDDSDIIYGDGVTDIDGNDYITVIIGNQEWMAENLRVTRYNNEDAIPTGLSDTEWGNTTNGACGIYTHNDIDGLDSDIEVVTAYGKLYNWFAVNDARGLCPEGWAVPSDGDWTQLVDYIVANGFTNESANPNGAGNALKSCRQVGSPLDNDCSTIDHPRWDAHDMHYGLDVFGFSALPGGYRSPTTGFYFIGYFGMWWSSTEYSSSSSWYRRLSSVSGHWGSSNRNKNDGNSVRCIKD